MSRYSDLILSQGATSHWRLDEVSGAIDTFAYDSIGSANLKINRTLVAGADAVVGTGFQFAGTDSLQYLSLGSSSIFNFNGANNLSYSWIMRVDKLDSNHGIISKRTSNTDNRHFSAFLYSAQSYALYFDLGGNSRRWGTGWIPEIGKYYHCAFTYEQSTNKWKLYVNGVLEASTTDQTPQATSGVGTTNFFVGVLGGSTSNSFNGVLDEVAMFMDKLLTPAQVMAQYATAFPIMRVLTPDGWKDADRRIL